MNKYVEELTEDSSIGDINAAFIQQLFEIIVTLTERAEKLEQKQIT